MSCRPLIRPLLLTSALLLSGCGGSLLQFPGVYKIDVRQGNIITQDMVDQLRPGMTKRQVVFVMGSPLVVDPFHQDRWDYVYNFQPGGGERVGERLTVYFENDSLVRIEGDYTPGGAEVTSSATP